MTVCIFVVSVLLAESNFSPLHKTRKLLIQSKDFLHRCIKKLDNNVTIKKLSQVFLLPFNAKLKIQFSFLCKIICFDIIQSFMASSTTKIAISHKRYSQTFSYNHHHYYTLPFFLKSCQYFFI